MGKDPAFLKEDGWYCVNDFTYTAPNKSGVYAIFLMNPDDGDLDLMYIGTASVLCNRINHRHEVFKTLYALRFMHKKYVVSYVCEIERESDRLGYEAHLIRTYNPKVNNA